MPPFKDLTGQRFGKLTAIEAIRGVFTDWRCSCECGGQVTTRGTNLTRGLTRSCGCLQLTKVMPSQRSHGRSRSREYTSWVGMKGRCLNRENTRYQDYGGRGITVCAEWRESFEAFYRDMGPRPSSRHSIDRKDNNGPYEPSNCRWATRIEQASNTSQNTYIEHRGERLTLAAWSRRVGIKPSTLVMRLTRYGWTVDKALSTPARHRAA